MKARIQSARALSSAILLWVVFLVLLVPTSMIFAKQISGEGGRYLYGILGTFSASLATAILLSADRGKWAASGLIGDRRTPVRFLGGALVGLASVGLILLLVFVGSGIRPMPTHGLTAATLLPLGALLPLALMEEIAFRGHSFALLQRTYGIWIAQVVTALAFSFYHLLNGWPLLLSFIGPGVWAFAFGIAAAKTRGIAAPTGLHFGVNFAQALVGLGSATPAASVFELTDANGLTGAVVGERTTSSGLAGQALILLISLLLTWRAGAEGGAKRNLRAEPSKTCER